MDKDNPRLRSVNKSTPPFRLNEFSNEFPFIVGEQLIYILATRGATDIEGKEWEQIFSKAINADWKPSNVGLDDIVLGNTAWGAKSVKNKNPTKLNAVRLISGRNDLLFSYKYQAEPGKNADETGELVLSIYNERVSKIRELYKHLRTVVLIRSYDLCTSVVFELDAIRYDPELYYWEWNTRGNLMGYSKKDKKHKFTWQPGGTQFTIIENIPQNHLIIKVKEPSIIDKEFVLNKIGYDKSWVSVIHKNG